MTAETKHRSKLFLVTRQAFSYNRTILKFIRKTSFIFGMLCLFFSAWLIHERDLHGATAIFSRPLMQTTGAPSDTDVGADIMTGIQLALSGGTNQSGRRTILSNSILDFGSVSFITPELIANGDSFLENNHLMLEAVVNVDIVFNGTNAVFTKLSKLRTSTNPFYKTYYSLTTSRSGTKTEIQEDPIKSDLTTITEPSTITLRMLFEVSPQQTGRLSDRFRLEATTL